MEEIPDNGCSQHPDCFSCPFSICRYEMVPGQLAREVRLLRARETKQQVEALTSAGMTQMMAVDEVARNLGYATRTVFRHLQVLKA